MKGDIILIRFPYSDLTSSKLRPALVIAEKHADVVAVAISSKIPNYIGDHEVLIDNAHPEFSLTNLHKTSVIFLDKIATIEKNQIIRILGRVGPQLKNKINKKLIFKL